MGTNNIKSKRVKDAVDFFMSWFLGMNQPNIREGINSIITIAERDAEERAIKAFDQWCRRVNKNIDETIHKHVILEFKQLLNGGQSDED